MHCIAFESCNVTVMNDGHIITAFRPISIALMHFIKVSIGFCVYTGFILLWNLEGSLNRIMVRVVTSTYVE